MHVAKRQYFWEFTTLSGSDLPFDIDNNFLLNFPHVALLKGNGFSFSNAEFLLKLNGQTKDLSNHARPRTEIDYLSHSLIKNFTLDNNLTISLTSNSEYSLFGRINLLMNMPLNVGCFKVIFQLFVFFLMIEL